MTFLGCFYMKIHNINHYKYQTKMILIKARYLGVIYCLVLLDLGQTSFAQSEIPKGHLWNAFHTEKYLTSNFAVKLKFSYFNAPPIFSPRFMDVGIKYNFSKTWSLNAFYRFKGVFNGTERRKYIDLAHKIKHIGKSKWNIKSRLRFQHKLTNESDHGLHNHYFLRGKIAVSHPLKASNYTQFFIAFESFYCLESCDYDEFNRFRFDVGLHSKVMPLDHDVRLFYRYQHDLEAGVKLADSHMISVVYCFRSKKS